MGLFNRSKKRISIKSAYPPGSRVPQLIDAALEKAKAMGGDPFAEYRRKGVFPEKYEYGMNCFLDRIYEEPNGEEIAQLTYEELKKAGGCSLVKDTSQVDIAWIPILISVENLAMGIKAQNLAVQKLLGKRKQALDIQAKEILKDDPIFLRKLEDESYDEYAYRLGILSIGLTNKSLEFHKRGNKALGERMELYAKIIEPIIKKYSHQKLSDEDTDILLFGGGGITTIIPENEVEFFDFLSKIGLNFWEMLWAALIDLFQKSYSSDQIFHFVDRMSEAYESGEKFQVWRKRIQAGERDLIWKAVLDDLEKMDSRTAKDDGKHFPRDMLLMMSAAIVLRLFGYQDKFTQAIQNADRSEQEFLFKKIAKETMVDVDRLKH